MKDYRCDIDDYLSKYCEDNNIEYSTNHCEAFVIKFEGFWRYIWYDCNEELPKRLNLFMTPMNI